MSGANVVFGGYELLRALGSGGMAEVFLVRPTDAARRNERYAMKRLLPELAAAKDFVELFEREMRLASRLQHPNLVAVHDSGIDAGRYFIVSEYVEGLDCWKMSQRLARVSEVLPLRHVVQIVAGVLEGLQYLHELRDEQGRPLGIVHRDVSPANILVSLRGEVKISDFGIALVASDRLETERRRRLRGKIRFLSPEQLEDRPIAARSDLFSVAVLMAEMILGRSPFHAQTDIAVMLNIRDVRLNLAEDFEQNVPAELRTILLRNLARNPADRHPSAAAMRDDILAAARGLGLSLKADYLALEAHRLLRPGDVGDEDVRRSSLTPLENAPVLARAPAAGGAGTAPAAKGPAYGVRKPDGALVGPVDFGALVQGVEAGLYTPQDEVATDGGPYLPLSAVPGIREHIQLLERVTSEIAVPAEPDLSGRFDTDPVAGVLIELAGTKETGLLVANLDAIRKEIYLLEGSPLYASSNVRDEQLGAFLVGRAVITPTELDMALAVLPNYQGNLADALLALEVIDPVAMFELLTEHVRQRLLDLFTWTRGTWWFYRGVACQHEFTIHPATAEILREGIDRSLEPSTIETWWTGVAARDLVPVPNPQPPRGWWPLGEARSSVLDALEHPMLANELLDLVRKQRPDLSRQSVIRAIHFALTAGLFQLGLG